MKPIVRPHAVALTALYAVAGFTALAYEILWARVLALQFGVSIFGVVIVVVAFMSGLGAGSLIGTRLVTHLNRPLRLFAIIEAAIASFALLTPLLLERLDVFASGWAPYLPLPQWYLVHGTAAAALLSLPALAMGIGFPLVVQAARIEAVALGSLYGWNTLGGALGALSPLMLLPALGWLASIRLVAATGLLVALGAFLLSRVQPQSNPSVVPRVTQQYRRGVVPYLAYGLVGMASLMLEVGWSRLYGMVLLRTEYVLAILLAVFLCGIGAGSLVARRLDSARWLGRIPFIAGATALASLWVLPWVSAWAEAAEFSSLGSAMAGQGWLLLVVMLPTTLALGLWLPLLAARYADPAAGPRFYAFNSLGGAAGAAAAGTMAIPLLGTAATLCLAAGLLLLAGLPWVRRRWVWPASLVLLLAAWPVYRLAPVHSLLPTTHADSRDVYVDEDAVSVTHVIEDANGQRLLLADLQRMDASTEPTAVESQRNQARLPLLLHPSPQSVLFLGLGTGISASGAAPYRDTSMEAVELSHGAIAAARTWFRPLNGAVLDRLMIVEDDARRYLRSTQRYYDVIIGDLFHPDMAGRSALLSLQQFERAKARLRPHGVFVQWIALNQFDRDTLTVVLRTFRQAFPNGVLFADAFRLALVGPQDHLQGAPAVLGNLANRGDLALAATGGEGPWTWLGRYWGMVDIGAGPIEDEWRPRIEYRLPRARFTGEVNLVPLLRWLLERRPPVQQAARDLAVAAADYPAFERAYLATELAQRSWLAALEGDADQASRLLRLAYTGNPADRWVGLALVDRMLETLPLARRQGIDAHTALTAALRVRADHPEALRALWRIEQQAGRLDQAAVYRERLRAVSPLDKTLRAEPAPD